LVEKRAAARGALRARFRRPSILGVFCVWCLVECLGELRPMMFVVINIRVVMFAACKYTFRRSGFLHDDGPSSYLPWRLQS
jgi:hypothetical protein